MTSTARSHAVRLAAALALVAGLGAAGPAQGSSAPVAPAPTASAASAASAASVTELAPPALKTVVLARGLTQLWDIQKLPGSSTLLFTERRPARLSVLERGQVRVLEFPSETVWTAGETGLMGLAVDPRFATNRRIYLCQGGFTADGGNDVRVTAWTLDEALTTATPAGVVISGIAATTGKHGGCRLTIARDGSLLIGTGDAITGTNPRNLDSLAGKTLRVNRLTGAPWPTNPYARETGLRRFVLTYGHRNVQGVAQRADGTLWSIEQGPDRDDEVNLLVPGGDYGWHPVPGYRQGVPMTDQSLPGVQQEARWSSGLPTLATSGGSFVAGAQWGELDGALAVACLKSEQVLFLSFDADGVLTGSVSPPELQRFERIRTVTRLPGGDLLLVTSNTGDGNVIIRVRPL